MNKAFASVLAVLILLAGCAAPRSPFGHDDPGLAPIEKAYRDLLDNYIDPPNPAVLLAAGYQGARKLLADRGISDTALQEPVWTQGADANWGRFSKAYGQLAAKYASSLGSDKLEYAAISQMASSLNDCQTHFFDPTALKEQRSQLSGQQAFGGIGVIMKNVPGHPTVIRVLDGPAKDAGLKPGDDIVAVEGKSTSEETFEQIRNQIRGPQGSSVRISVHRPGTAEPLEFTVTRAQVEAPIIEAAILNNSIGYLHLYSFPPSVLPQLDRALNIFDERGVKAVIIDLRANTGGDQQTLVAAMSRFVRNGVVEVQIERNGQRSQFEVDPSVYWKNPKPLALLIDDDTQAGGEIFAKAIQENGVGRLFGLPTGGCASSGHIFDLSDGSAIEISTAKVVSGKGAEINHVGVTPDQRVEFPVTELAAGRDPQMQAAFQYLETANGPSGAGSASSSQSAPASAPAFPILKPLNPSSALPQAPRIVK